MSTTSVSHLAGEAPLPDMDSANYLTSFKPSVRFCSSPTLIPLFKNASLLHMTLLKLITLLQCFHLASVFPSQDQVPSTVLPSSLILPIIILLCLFPLACHIHKGRDLSYFTKSPKL